VATVSQPESGTQAARSASDISAPRKATRQPVAHPLAVVALVWTGLFMTTLDASIVNIGLPSIARAFGTPLSGTIEWVIIGYLVVAAALLLSMGRLSDMVGRTPIWMTGLGLFTLASVLCGGAPSVELLIMARLLQGAGAALLLATGTAMLTDAVPPDQRGRALGLGVVAIALGTSVGPTVGGVITEHLSWRWIFYVNVPVGLVALMAARRFLPRLGGRKEGRFDPVGGLLLGIGLAALTLGLSFGGEWGWTSARLLVALAIGVIALVGGLLAERQALDPIIDLKLFRNRVFSSAIASMTLSMLALFSVGFLLPFYFEELRGFSTAHSGWLLTPLPLMLAIVAPISGAASDRRGSRLVAPLGLAINAVALFLLGRLDTTSSTWDIVWRLGLAGVGQGLFQAPNVRALMGAAPATEQGAASGLLATARITGQALSVAVAGAVFLGLGGSAGAALLALRTSGTQLSGLAAERLQSTFLHGFHASLTVCAGFAALGALAALVRGEESRKVRGSTPASGQSQIEHRRDAN
jgi:EmrB/QacA subfamily drug resistance transporter